YGLLDEQTKFLKGWFKDTLPDAAISQLALMRLDGDMYESTMDALTSLYPRLSPGGYVVIDDYHVVPACKAAVEDYCAANELQPEITEIDGSGVYWRKPGITRLKDDSAGPNRQIESPETQISRLHQAISELSLNVITKLDHCLTVRDGHINGLNHALTEQNRTIDEQNQVIQERNQAVAERDGKIADYDAEISELKEQVEALLSSTSWRITGPMRGVKGIFSALRSKSPAEADTGTASGTVFENDNYATVTETDHYSSDCPANETMLSQAVSELSKHVVSTNLLQTRPTENRPPADIWRDDLHLKVDNVNFHLAWDADELRNGVSTADDFLLGKTRPMVEKLIEMEQQQRISKIFEMGIFKGGSVALHDSIFRPQKIVAIEYMPEPVPALLEYISRYNKHNSVKPYYGVSQADRAGMEKILSREFPKRDISLIVDDASHLYEETRDAFNISFPFLALGGIYIIEDWAWAHWAGDAWQSETSYFYGRTALSNLLIELFMLAASRPDFITDIHIAHSTITITKGQGPVPAKFNLADHYLLRGKHFNPCL
ncbi:MAG TPA: TylF/MycF/NovP-related O-methyltransferase, partial [Nitrosospira sp.]|nr:TylF/MycF/NovP-related O-methyltransferase [Nitrosospira sp.]